MKFCQSGNYFSAISNTFYSFFRILTSLFYELLTKHFSHALVFILCSRVLNMSETCFDTKRQKQMFDSYKNPQENQQSICFPVGLPQTC